ncbi:MAG: ATP-dependent DNA ligase [Candidatus Bathyarchaeia archaeon]|jgi:DNA ligase-1
MSQTPFSEFANVCRRVEATSKRTKKVTVLANFLHSLHADEVIPAVTFFSGHAFPGADERVLDVGGATLWKMDRRANQSTLVTRPATLLDVYETFDRIAKATGSGSRQRKEALVETLLGRLGAADAEYLRRIIFGEMRIGAVEGVMLDAISAASNIQLDDVRRAYMLLGDLGRVAKLSLTEGAAAVQAVGVELFVPIRPMLAEMAQDPEEVFREHGGTTALEYKYDGARIQLHVKGGVIRIFSRRLTDVTDSLPDIVRLAKDALVPRAREFLVEGEVVAVGKGGKPSPFQDLMRRFRRVHHVKIMTTQIPLRLHLFDIIYLNGKMLIDAPNEERWGILQTLVPPDLLATRVVSSRVEDAKELMHQAVLAGHEGIMAKDLKSSYTPGVRGKKWFKIKPVETLDVVIVAADWGSGRRKGWLSNYHLAVRDDQTGEYLVVGKTFKGLTDDEFSTITEKLSVLKTRTTEYTVYVKPSVVVEVAFNEIQRSPNYRSKFALRFARITRFRDDKRPEDADTQSRLRTLYENQFRFKARADFEVNK